MIHLTFDPNNLHFFDAETEESICKNIPDSYKVNVNVKNRTFNLFNQDITLPECMNIEDGNYDLVIPNDVLCNGDDLSLTFDKEEEIKGIKLSRTSTNGMYIHLNTTNIEDYNKVSLLYEKLVFIKDGEEVVKAIPESIELDIKFVVEGKGKNKKYVFDIENNTVDADFAKLQKAAFVDGRECHKKTYKIISKLTDVSISNSGVLGKITRELNYKNNSYYEISINDKIIYIKKSENLSGDIYLSFDYKACSILDPVKSIIIA
jgi:hypothetical protein